MESNLVRFGVSAIALLLAALFVLATFVTHREGAPGERRRRTLAAAVGVLLWLGAGAVAALSGVLGRFDVRPPPMLLWFNSAFVLALVVACSPFGKRLALGLPYAALVGFQAFRLPLELTMHRAMTDGLMPRVMSFSGYNFDIVTGITALGLGLVLARRALPRWVLVAWNALGLTLLAIVVSVAFAASPVFRAFGDGELNVWVTRFPYCWMAMMVGSALFGHVLVARKLSAEPVEARGAVASS